jgi:hypothetical protein
MDVARTPPKKTRRNLLIGGGVLALGCLAYLLARFGFRGR